MVNVTSEATNVKVQVGSKSHWCWCVFIMTVCSYGLNGIQQPFFDPWWLEFVTVNKMLSYGIDLYHRRQKIHYRWTITGKIDIRWMDLCNFSWGKLHEKLHKSMMDCLYQLPVKRLGYDGWHSLDISPHKKRGWFDMCGLVYVAAYTTTRVNYWWTNQVVSFCLLMQQLVYTFGEQIRLCHSVC